MLKRLVPLLFCLAAPVLAGAPAPGYLGELQARAAEQQLHRDPYWRILLHAHRGLTGRWVSRIDDPRFFLAPDGKTDPAAELQATLAGFFEPPADNPGDHPRCRFPARFAWLAERLAIDPDRLPVPACEPFDRTMAELRLRSATLIFPSAYMNTPASMFGHTLLVFDSENRNRLLSRAVNYAALTQQRFGPIFAFAGITGFYKGYYSIEKYYDKVEQYNDVNHRDMWEYELDLSPDELKRMILHTWELQNIYSRYYFFKENCSYNLLFLLDAARPTLGLAGDFRFWVIPIDTVKAVAERGLIRDTVYRPSAASIIRHLGDSLPEDAQQAAVEVARARRPASTLTDAVDDPAVRIRTADLAAEYAQYLYTTETITPEDYRPRIMEILVLRSRLGPGTDPAREVPVPGRPDRGHAAARLGVGAGTRNGEGFAIFRLRPAYHDLVDHETGYDPGAQIQFLHGEVRWFPDTDRWRVESLHAVDVVSMAPRGRFFQPPSWSLRAGLEQFGMPGGGEDQLTGMAETRSGITWSTGDWGLLMAGLGADARAGGPLDRDYLLGGGPALRWVGTGSTRTKTDLALDATWFGIGGDTWRYRATLRHQVFRTVNRGLLFELRHQTLGSRHVNEAALSLNLYF